MSGQDAGPRFLVLDNYDSFVYNLVQYLGELGVACDVVRNDRITLDQVRRGGYDGIVISPGPGTPVDTRYFGVCMDVIREMGPTTPILGVCLGHQGIIHAFGGRVVNARRTRHGKTSPVRHAGGSALFEGVRNPFQATRYHSLVGDRTVIPPCLRVTATADDDGEVMAVEHADHPILGVQFHPESIMTQDGKRVLANFVRRAREEKGEKEGRRR